MTDQNDIVRRADERAVKEFGGPSDKFVGAEPPINHLRRVAEIIRNHGGTPKQIAAGLLHDVVEDAGGHRAVPGLREEFDDVIDLVEACTDSWADTRIDPATNQAFEQKKPWWDRKVPYIAHIASAPEDALLVCAADKIDNVRRTHEAFLVEGHDAWKRFNRASGRDGQLWYYRRVTEELERRDVPAGGAIAELRTLVDAFVEDVRTTSTGGDVDAAYAVWCEAERSNAPAAPTAAG
jgi:(p)ppGpp synthase/HD superfamily hydrolase